MGKYTRQRGFTLIELSIVLVIIGLLVGGVLVGQDLIRSSGERAQITQIERYNQAVNTFRGKFGQLPGDMDANTAARFGFTPRGNGPAEGDGNGIIEGLANWQQYNEDGWAGVWYAAGETVMFWVDLTTANGLNINLIDGSFSGADPVNNPASDVILPQLNSWLPPAKIGQGNYVIVWSAFGTNYFSIRPVTDISWQGWLPYSTNSGASGWEGLSVRQAYDIDRKMDDGLPETGNIIAVAPSGGGGGVAPYWAGTQPSCVGSCSIYHGVLNTAPIAAAGTTCFDNGGNGSAAAAYSLSQNSGNGVNCALSFKFQ